MYRKIFTRNNNYELSNDQRRQRSSSRNDLDAYYNNAHYHHRQMPNGHRTRSETNLYYDPAPRMHLSPRYERRLANGSGAPISTNPLWTAASPKMIGSQPNLLTRESTILHEPIHRNLSPPMQRRMTSVPLQHPLYANYSNNKPLVTTQQQENQQKRPGPLSQTPNSNKKQTTQPQYLDTNEFILRASNGVLLKNSQYSSRHAPDVSRAYRAHSNDLNSNSNTMLDVYY